MDRETATRKVLRCLRLAASANANEAATALRQARALMDLYGLTEADAYASEIHEAEAATRCRGAELPRSLMFLGRIVADGFRCDVIVHRTRGWRGEGSTIVQFYGGGSDAEIAAYAFAVLRRTLEADKAKHTRRIRKRVNKEARGEEFALHWVAAVARLFPKAELPDERRDAIAAKMKAQHGELDGSAGREVKNPGKANWRDGAAGYAAGSVARVNAGLGGSAQRKLERTA